MFVGHSIPIPIKVAPYIRYTIYMTTAIASQAERLTQTEVNGVSTSRAAESQEPNDSELLRGNKGRLPPMESRKEIGSEDHLQRRVGQEANQ